MNTVEIGRGLHGARRRRLCWAVVLLMACGLVCPSAWGQGAGKTSSKSRTGKAAETSGPQHYSSRWISLTTDMPADEAKELLQRLETILTQVGRYWGKPNSQIIEMYVVKDLALWPRERFPPEAYQSVATGGGLTISQTTSAVDRNTGRKTAHLGTKSVVYAVADRGTPLHEAVHAYCAQSFGTTGPTWFSEGIAELGQYWRDKDLSVQIHPEVMKYLQRSEPPDLAEIVDLRQTTGDSWQNYAWRWALCHLLAFNPNYAARFRPLGLDLLREGDQSFQSVYGSMAPEIAFEYRQFLAQLEEGYRVDLCAWDWKTKPLSTRGNSVAQTKIDAGKGWQSSKLSVQSGVTYTWTADGEWQTSKEAAKVTADGDEDGTGRLVGVIFEDYQLSELIEFGREGRWTAPSDGVLFLRCRDAWGSVADNSGTVNVRFRRAE